MATLSITVPDRFLAEFLALMRSELGEAATGAADRALLGLYVRRQLGPAARAKRRRSNVAAAVAAEFAAREAAEQALATERAARLFAEAQADTEAAADIGGIS